MLIKPLLLNALEVALNSYLALDPNVPTTLAPLAGKVIAITLLPFNETLYFCPSAENIQLLETCLDTPDTTLTGSIWAFGAMGLSATPMRSIFSGQVTIEGDMHVGHKFQQLFAQLDLNLESILAQYTGEKIAQQLNGIVQATTGWVQESVTTLKLNTSELLQEETRDLPAPAEAEIFFRQVDTLRHDFDRLQQRVERLQGPRNSKE